MHPYTMMIEAEYRANELQQQAAKQKFAREAQRVAGETDTEWVGEPQPLESGSGRLKLIKRLLTG